jgi:hypothetical protein
MPTSESPEGCSFFPRVYRASGGWLTALTFCGLVLTIGGMTGKR